MNHDSFQYFKWIIVIHYLKVISRTRHFNLQDFLYLEYQEKLKHHYNLVKKIHIAQYTGFFSRI